MKEKQTAVTGFDPEIYPMKIWVMINGDAETINESFTNHYKNGLFEELPKQVLCAVAMVEEKESKDYGVLVYTTQTSISPEVAAHEAVHVADAIFSHIQATGQDFREGNEPYAYLVGYAFKCIMQGVKNYKSLKNKKDENK